MLPSLLVLLTAANAGGTTFTVEPQTPVVVVLASPKGVAPVLPTNDVFRVVEAALRARSRLTVRTPESVGLDVSGLLACPLDERLLCWTRHAASALPHGFLMVLSLVADDRSSASINGVIIDVEAESKLSATEKDLPIEERENRLYKRTHQMDRRKIQNAKLKEALQGEIQKTIENLARGRSLFAAHGDVLITADEGLLVHVDDREVGVTAKGVTTLENVAPGAHQIELRDPTDQTTTFRTTVEVTGAAAVTINARPQHRLDHPLHVWSSWAGVGLAAVGVAFALTSATHDSSTPVYPLGMPAPAAYYVNTCNLTGGDDIECAGRGLPLVPFGAALAVAGTTAAVGYGLIAEGEDYAWWWAAIGAVAGGLTYGIMLAAE